VSAAKPVLVIEPLRELVADLTRDPMAAQGLVRHSSVNTTLAHYIKDVPEVTANGMAQVEQLFSELDVVRQVQ
jgi:hypothetical protein